MSMNELAEIRKRRGFVDRCSEAKELVESGRNIIKFNLQKIDSLDEANGEGVWGYLSDEDYKLWENDDYHGTVTAILLNWPITWNVLFWGVEVRLRCHGDARPTLDPDWVHEMILDTDWYKKYSEGFSLCVKDWYFDDGTLIFKSGKDYKIVGLDDEMGNYCDVFDCEDGKKHTFPWDEVELHFQFY